MVRNKQTANKKKGKKIMAKFANRVAKKGAMKMGAKLAAGAPVADFVLVDNGDDTVTVFGVDAMNQQVDISSVATLAATSSDPTQIVVDPPVGMTYAEHAAATAHPAVGIAVNLVATWNDGSLGPFSASVLDDIVAGPASGLVVQHGPVTTH